MVDIIFVNLHGTVLPVSGELVVRRGFSGFVERHGAKRIVLTSHLPEEKACEDVKVAGLVDKFYKLITVESYPYHPQNNANMPDYRMWAMDFKTWPARTVVVTSLREDLEQAIWYAVPAIAVPAFTTPKDSFSFDRVYANSIATKLKFFGLSISGKEQIIIKK
ncbi:MAG: hypothetical protein HY438_01320 [DPANN group archaeon]|nr:hypothetical protein [DPANN group archaeon]